MLTRVSVARTRNNGRGAFVAFRAWARHEPAGAVAVGWVVTVVLATALGPLVAPSPDQINAGAAFAAPSLNHLFGTDELGRDILSRVLNGGRISLLASALSTALAMLLGTTWALAAVEFGKWTDELLMRLADLLMGIPLFLLALAAVAAFGPGLGDLVVITGVLMAPLTARVVRAEAHRQGQQPYYAALVALGTGRFRRWLVEVLPNMRPVMLAQISINVATSLMVLASLSYLGFGIEPPAASWGTVLQDGYSHLYNGVWYPLAPLIAIVGTIAAFNVLGERLGRGGRGARQ